MTAAPSRTRTRTRPRPRPRPRDTARARVYRAEDAVAALFDAAAATPGRPLAVHVAGSTLTLPAERRFADAASMQRYADALTRAEHLPPVRVRDRKGSPERAHYTPAAPPSRPTAEIAVPVHPPAGARPFARELVLLHELAHHAAAPVTDHGPEFRHAFIDLLNTYVGPEAALLMRVTFSDHGLT